MFTMKAQEERFLKRMCQRLLGLSQGKAGSRARAFCAAVGARYSTVVNKLNPNGASASRFPAQLDVSLLVALCRFTRNTHPLRYLARILGEKLVARRARRATRGMEVAA